VYTQKKKLCFYQQVIPEYYTLVLKYLRCLNSDVLDGFVTLYWFFKPALDGVIMIIVMPLDFQMKQLLCKVLDSKDAWYLESVKTGTV
jgi:hypothetical protein